MDSSDVYSISKTAGKDGWDELGSYTVGTGASAAHKLDVVFAIDATGSMGDEISEVKRSSLQIMQEIADLAPDSDVAFGVVTMVDYPNYYDSYGYADYYGDDGDYAYRTDLNITTDRAAVASEINQVQLRSGADGPQDYSRTLWELTQEYEFRAGQELGIDWRPGARRIVILFGDNASHDNSFFSRSYGGDPGRDEEMFTEDDLDYESVVAQVGAAGISVMTVDSSRTGSGADPWQNFEYIAKQTGGIHYLLGDVAEIPSAIVNMIGDTSYEVSVHSPYTSGFSWQKECQTHAHWNSDVWQWWSAKGLPYWSTKTAPEKISWLEQKYADNGYSYVCVTEHTELSQEPSPATSVNHVRRCQEITAGDHHLLAIGVDYPDGTLVIVPGTRQEDVKAVMEHGGVPIAAHPNTTSKDRLEFSWALSDLEALARAAGGRGCMEIFNNSADQWLRILYRAYRWNGWAEREWDLALGARTPIWGTAGDDFTPNVGNMGLDGGCIRILTQQDATTQTDFMACLRTGDFYATQGKDGPRFTEISVNPIERRITASTEGKSIITFVDKNGIDAPKKGRVFGSSPAWLNGVTSAVYEYRGDEEYVRVQATQGAKNSWSQPIFVDRLIQKSLTLASPGTMTIGDAVLNVIGPTGTNVNGATVGTGDLPGTAPPGGYYGDVYSFTADNTLTSIELTVTYRESDIVGVNPSRLVLYQYDPANSAWNDLSSTVNPALRTVTASPASLGLFALSAKDEADNTAPTVTFTAPAEGASISAGTTASVDTGDDNGAVKVTFFLDGTPFAADSFAADGWSTVLDPTLIAAGNHTLRAEATDAAGNVGQASIAFTVPAAVAAAPPTVTVAAPADGAVVSGIATLTGSVTAASSVDVGVFCDGTVVGLASVDEGNQWSFDLDTAGLSNGARAVVVRAIDAMGATGEATITLNVNNVAPFSVAWGSALDLPPTLPIGPCVMSILDMRGKTAAKVSTPAVSYGTYLALTNAGETAWGPDGISIAYRWKNGAGTVVLEGSQPLGLAAEPGQKLTVYVGFSAPTAPGKYTLDIVAQAGGSDVEQENAPVGTTTVSPTAKANFSSTLASPKPFIPGNGRTARFFGLISKSQTYATLGEWNGVCSSGALPRNGVYKAKGAFRGSNINIGFSVFGASK